MAEDKKQLSAAALETVNAVLNATPDMLELLAEYCQLPQGVFQVELKTSSEPIRLKDPDIPYFRIEYILNEIVGLSDKTDELDVPKLGSVASELFDITNTVGQGLLRRRLESLRAIMGADDTITNGDILTQANGMIIGLICGPMRTDDKDNKFTSVKTMIDQEQLNEIKAAAESN